MRTLLIVLATLVCVASGACSTPLEREFDELASEESESGAEAEALYAEAKEFREGLEKMENAPKDLLTRTRGLEQRRAKEFFVASAKDWSPSGMVKAAAALVGAGLDPKRVADELGINVNLKELEDDREFLKSDDPRLWK